MERIFPHCCDQIPDKEQLEGRKGLFWLLIHSGKGVVVEASQVGQEEQIVRREAKAGNPAPSQFSPLSLLTQSGTQANGDGAAHIQGAPSPS